MTENNSWAEALRSGQPLAQAVAASKQFAPVGDKVKAGAREKKVLPVASPSTLPTMHVGRGISYGNLTWFPIFTDAPVIARDYVTQAGSGKIAVVEDVNPSVGHLQVKNDLDQPVLLFEGALLEGGWQHRALTHTVWVNARSSAEIPVVCVEAGRWNGVATQHLGNKSAPARVRRAMRGIYQNDSGIAVQAMADQGAVWNEVRAYAENIKKSRPTESLVEMANEVERDLADLRLAKPAPLYGQRGVLVAVAGKPLAMEVFDHPDTLAERLESILDAYLPEAMEMPAKACPGQLARDFVERVAKLGVAKTENDGRLRNKADKYVASEAVLRGDGSFLHLATLNAQHELVLAA